MGRVWRVREIDRGFAGWKEPEVDDVTVYHEDEGIEAVSLFAQFPVIVFVESPSVVDTPNVVSCPYDSELGRFHLYVEEMMKEDVVVEPAQVLGLPVSRKEVPDVRLGELAESLPMLLPVSSDSPSHDIISSKSTRRIAG